MYCILETGNLLRTGQSEDPNRIGLDSLNHRKMCVGMKRKGQQNYDTSTSGTKLHSAESGIKSAQAAEDLNPKQTSQLGWLQQSAAEHQISLEESWAEGPQISGCILGNRNCLENFTWPLARCITVFLKISERILRIIQQHTVWNLALDIILMVRGELIAFSKIMVASVSAPTIWLHFHWVNKKQHHPVMHILGL